MLLECSWWCMWSDLWWVLILVVMEYALRAFGISGNIAGKMVLILVVMEYALRDYGKVF